MTLGSRGLSSAGDRRPGLFMLPRGAALAEVDGMVLEWYRPVFTVWGRYWVYVCVCVCVCR